MVRQDAIRPITWRRESSTDTGDGNRFGYDEFRRRLLESRPPASDPGLSRLVDDGPRTPEEIRAELRGRVDGFERDFASRVIGEKPGDSTWKVP